MFVSFIKKVIGFLLGKFTVMRYPGPSAIRKVKKVPADFVFQFPSPNNHSGNPRKNLVLSEARELYLYGKEKYVKWSENKFHATVHWDDYFKLIEPYFFVQSKLESFRRNEIALAGLFSWGKPVELKKTDQFRLSGDYVDHAYQRAVFLPEEEGSAKANAMLLNWYKVYQSTKKNIRKFNLQEDEVGNPIVVLADGRRITANLCLFSQYLRIVDRYMRIPVGRRACLAEIGSGYGGFVKLMKDRFPNTTCILIDLPQTLLLAQYYLTTNFPDCSVFPATGLYDGGVIPVQELMQYDFVFMTPDVLERVERKSFIDLICNMTSLQEMNIDYVKYYFSHINHLLSGYFYSVNREQAPARYGGVNFKDWPFEGRWETVLKKQPDISTYPVTHLQYIGRKIPD